MSLKQALENFIISVPTLFIKQYPYAWFPAIVFWTWPPGISLVFFFIITVGILSLHWRVAAWISEMRRKFVPANGPLYVERTPIPIGTAARTIAMLLVSDALLAWLGNRFGLSYWQTFILVAGFTLCYMDTRFFGATTVYIVTMSGIAIYYIPGHVDYRIFLWFKEMDKVVRLDKIEKIPESWSVLSRLRTAQSGILLVPRNPRGFTKRLNEVLLTPTDVDKFLELIPSTLVANQL